MPQFPRRNFRAWGGAPRPMKMGTTVSPRRYDAAAADAIRPDNQRRTAILRYASRAAVFPISGWSGYASAAAISINPGNGVMGPVADV
jgi:hypothetical protein